MKKSRAQICIGILAGLTGIMAGLTIYFFYLWQTEINSRDNEVAGLTKILVDHMKTGEENFKWRQFVEKMGIETLLKEYWKISDSDNHNDIEVEIRERLLNHGGNPTEPLEILVEKMFKDSFGKDQLINFVDRAKKTIRIYEEERGKKWKQERK